MAVGTSFTHLVPMQEMAPGSVGVIRNQVISGLVAQASRELSLPETSLVVRDVRPVLDLTMYSGGTTAATIEDWIYTATSGTGFISVTGAQTMADQRYVALFGVRDLRLGIGIHATSTLLGSSLTVYTSYLSLIKINVGGADKAIWDTKCVQPYKNNLVALTPSAVVIPQNSSFNISYYKTVTTAGLVMLIQLIGVVVEPRGKIISP